MGDENGAGFVWQVVTLVKVGLQYETGCCWSWRAEYAYGKQPIPSSAVLFGILAPGVVEQHHSAGTTKESSNGHAVSLAITHAFSSTVCGPNPQEAPGQQTFELKMDQWELEIGYAFYGARLCAGFLHLKAARDRNLPGPEHIPQDW